MPSDFFKEGEGSGRLRARAREAGGEGVHGGAAPSARAPSGKQNRKALCQQPGPWAAGLSAPFCSAGFWLAPAAVRNNAWISFFLSFFFSILIEGGEGPEPLIEQLSIVEASGTVCP